LGNEAVELYVEAAANPMILGRGTAAFRPTPLGDRDTAGTRPQYRLTRAELAVFEPQVWELAQDLEVLGQLAAELDLGDPRRWQILRALDRSLDVVDVGDIVGSAPAARDQLAGVLTVPARASAHRISAVGHAHIDSAWLWPIRETVRKVARTAANVIELMDTHPDFVHAMSSAQQFAWLKQHQPEIYARLAEKVKAGQFVPVGGMWVESDTNLPGGEAMARQLAYGKRFFLDEFGVETREVWLPDSFGYSAALPQLVTLAGARYFLTQKLSWNQTNRFPHHSFFWEGLDGTRVFTHFPPVDTYNAELSGAQLAHAVRNFADKAGSTCSLVPFGWGDGGGGPTREMLARARRLRDLDGSPRVVVESPADFFARAEQEYPDAPVWSGELYLELHRGTYTSQFSTKQGNRRCEHLLREAELWCATASVRAGASYPFDELDRLWKTVLLHQFHDILPGSSIAWVHREAVDTYAAVADELGRLISSAQGTLAGSSGPTLDGGDRDGGDGRGDRIVFNAAPHARNGVPAMGAARVRAADARCAVSPDDPTVAPTLDRPGVSVTPELAAVAVTPELAAVSVTPELAGVSVTPELAGVMVTPGASGGYILQNAALRVVVDARGLLTSVRDLDANREALAPGSVGNLLQVHPDTPNAWDAWDIDPFYRNVVTNLDSDDVELSAIAGGVVITRRFGGSRISQAVTLPSGARRVDVDCDIDWREPEKLLKVAFDVDVAADRSAAETQFGHVMRPTHTNTSWDAARFEICAHRFLHVGEPGYGIAVVNDSTYGHDVSRRQRRGGGVTTVVRLSLLRAPRSPDPNADQGRHRLRYALVPGARIVDAIREGYRINLSERIAHGIDVQPLFSIDDDGVVIESVKLADDRSGSVVVRAYEALGRRAVARIRAAFPCENARLVDLLERPLADAEALHTTPDSVVMTLRPFQIVTICFQRSA
jgi:alpha-mannosidase